MREIMGKWVQSNNRRISPSTQGLYSMIIWRFADSAPDDIRYLTTEHIERYLDSLKNYANCSINNHLSAIKIFCRWAAERYELPDPAAKIRALPKPPPHQRVITEAEYHKVLAVCKGSEAAVIKMLANTGLRAAEMQSLKPENISQDRQSLWVVGKGKKSRVIPLNKTAREILAYKPKPFYFLKNRRYRNALYKLCKKLSIRAGVPSAGPHAYRHFFATRLMQKGVPLAKISKILGHASTSFTEKIYIHWCVSDVVGVTDVLDD